MSSRTHFVPPDRWRALLLLAACAGVVAAGLDVPLRWACQQVGWGAAAGSTISAGSIVPVGVIVHLLYPHRGASIAALMAAMTAYSTCVLFIHGVVVRGFPVRQLAVDLAFVGIAETAIGAILILSLHRIFAARVRIGFDPHTRCGACGYPLRGLSEPRCPECGRPFEMAAIDAAATCGPDACGPQ
jgi:hypothetical protein